MKTITIVIPAGINLDIDVNDARKMVDDYKFEAISNCVNAVKNSVVSSAKSGHRNFEFRPVVIATEHGIPTDVAISNIQYSFEAAGFRTARSDHSMVISW